MILLLSPSPIGRKMAGPAIRFVEFARQLTASGLEVVLGSPEPVEPDLGHSFEVVHFHRSNISGLAGRAKVIVIQGLILRRHPVIKRYLGPGRAALVVDLYDPIFLETLAQFEPGSRESADLHNFHLAQLIESVVRADFMMCASIRQRDLWLGFLAALNRVNPATFAADRSLNSLLKIVPFGLSREKPTYSGPGMQGLAGIEPEDRVVLWNGGVWEWFSPEPLIRAIGRLAETEPRLKLVFMGVKNPDSKLPESRVLKESRRLVAELGLEDRVIFNDWVAYDDRAGFLLQAEAGACLYPQGLETDYSFRTRLLDLIWAGRPILCSGGDELGRLIEAHGLGLTVPDHEVETLTRALAKILELRATSPEFDQRAARVAEELQWEKVAEPLVEFCQNPTPAPDGNGPYRANPSPRLPLSYYLRRAVVLARSGELVEAIKAKLKG